MRTSLRRSSLRRSSLGRSSLRASCRNSIRGAHDPQLAERLAVEVWEAGLSFHDYKVEEDGTPALSLIERGQFRCAGSSHMDFGFQLTANETLPATHQTGHFLCMVEFEPEGNEFEVAFEYNMSGDTNGACEGICAYLLDPSIEGWDTDFSSTGPLGLTGKKGAIVGVGLDNSGNFTGGSSEWADHLTVRAADGEVGQNLTSVKTGGFQTGYEDWHEVKIQFNLAHSCCSVQLNGKPMLKNVSLEGVILPKKLCVAVCGSASDKEFMTAVNFISLGDIDEVHKMEEEFFGIPYGCTDFAQVDGAFVECRHAADWRLAGYAKIGRGFELCGNSAGDVEGVPTDQQGHLLCRRPVRGAKAEICASLDFAMEMAALDSTHLQPASSRLHIYLSNSAAEGWDAHFNSSGSFDMANRPGVIMGVVIDAVTGSLTAKRGDGSVLCTPITLGRDAVLTETDQWHKFAIKFNMERMVCDILIDDKAVLEGIQLNGVLVQDTVCLGVAAATTRAQSSFIAVNSLQLEGDGVEDSSKRNERVRLLRRVFQEIDLDGDGLVNRIELIKALRNDSGHVRGLLGLPGRIQQNSASHAQFEKIFQSIDADESNAIDFGEFLRYFDSDPTFNWDLLTPSCQA